MTLPNTHPATTTPNSSKSSILLGPGVSHGLATVIEGTFAPNVQHVEITITVDPADPNWVLYELSSVPGYVTDVQDAAGIAHRVNDRWLNVSGPGSIDVGCPSSPGGKRVPDSVLRALGEGVPQSC